MAAALIRPMCLWKILRRQQWQQQNQRQVLLRFLSASLSSVDNAKVMSTKKWLEQVVVGEKLCPFASPLLKHAGLLRIVGSSARTTEEAIDDVKREVYDLVGDPHAKHETTLVVLDDYEENSGTAPFVHDYLEFVRLSWELQADAVDTYASKVQLVLFHPRATHQTYASVPQDDDDNDGAAAGDYTIRSPYPTIHLLREEDVLKAVQSGYPDLEYLPSRNKAKLIEQGLETCRQRLQDCYTNEN